LLRRDWRGFVYTQAIDCFLAADATFDFWYRAQPGRVDRLPASKARPIGSLSDSLQRGGQQTGPPDQALAHRKSDISHLIRASLLQKVGHGPASDAGHTMNVARTAHLPKAVQRDAQFQLQTLAGGPQVGAFHEPSRKGEVIWRASPEEGIKLMEQRASKVDTRAG
jgi:hypothetical protein